MHAVRMIGLVFTSALAMGLGCQLIAGVPSEVTLRPGTGGDDGSSVSAGSSGVGAMGGSGGMGGLGGMGGAGGTPECSINADCANSECTTEATCDNGVCKWIVVNDGTLTNSQLYGDCKDRVCDGMGNVKEIPGDTSKDAYDWGLDNPCYAKACNGFANPMSNDGATCTTPWGNANGQCNSFKCIECLDDMACGMMEICREGRCIASTCEGGVKDGTETDIDCGGANCLPCTVGKECTANADCDGQCDLAAVPPKCIAPTCADGIKNGDETDLDCGGTLQCAKENPPKKCSTAKKCILPSDCESGVCKSGVCLPALCTDFTQNGDEAGVDCGGIICPPCQP